MNHLIIDAADAAEIIEILKATARGISRAKAR